MDDMGYRHVFFFYRGKLQSWSFKAASKGRRGMNHSTVSQRFGPMAALRGSEDDRKKRTWRRRYPKKNWHILKNSGWKMKFPFEMVPFFEDMLIFRWVYLVSRLEGMYSSSSVEGSFASCKMCDLIWKHGFGLWLPKRPFFTLATWSQWKLYF